MKKQITDYLFYEKSGFDEFKKPYLTRIMREKRKKLILPLLKKKWKILDIACGDGWFTKYLNKRGYNCIGIDLSPPLTDPFIKANANDIPFKDNYFDCVICISLLEHVKCENELKRVLKKQGLLIAECPAKENFILKLLDSFNLVQGGLGEHIRIVDFNKLPFTLINKKTYGLGYLQFGVLKNAKG